MPYTYEASRHHSRHTFEENTLEEAILSAAADLELGEAWPAKIVAPDGSVLWEQSGPLTQSCAAGRQGRPNERRVSEQRTR